MLTVTVLSIAVDSVSLGTLNDEKHIVGVIL